MRKQLSMTEVSALLMISQQQALLHPVLKAFNTTNRTVPPPESVVRDKTTRTSVRPNSLAGCIQYKAAL